MNKQTLALSLFTMVILFLFTACTPSESNISQNDLDLDDELESALEGELFSQDDFSLSIGTLPYRGAVLFIDYFGDIDISGYELWVEIVYDEKITQRDLVVETEGDSFVSEIVDLMYLPGDDLEFILKIKEEENVIFESNHSEQLQRYPWKDWMLAEGEWFSFTSPNYHNFKYDYPDCSNNLGAHSSWDINTHPGAPVYSGTMGAIFRIHPGSVEIFNPHVGALLQYGHIDASQDLYVGKLVMPGEHIGYVQSKWKHIHYSTIRPYKLGWNRQMNMYWLVFNVGQEQLYGSKYYKDPFYFHEPTTLGYWNEATLPPGTKEEMLRLYQKDNSDILIPATKPLDTE